MTLSLKSNGNLWGNSNTKFVILDIKCYGLDFYLLNLTNVTKLDTCFTTILATNIDLVLTKRSDKYILWIKFLQTSVKRIFLQSSDESKLTEDLMKLIFCCRQMTLTKKHFHNKIILLDAGKTCTFQEKNKLR